MLGDIAQALKVEPVLVLSALGDTEEAAAYAGAAKAIGARRLLITRLDMARRLGGLLAAAECGLALAGASITPHFAFGFKTLSAQLIAHRMIDLLARAKP
jgi:flagellar biosynthesis protein FlhF